MTKQLAAVAPEVVVFENVQPGLVYAQTVSLRNLSSHAQRVRVKHPSANGPFKLIFTPGKSVAPGLEVVADVHFELPPPPPQDASNGDVVLPQAIYRDRVVVQFGDDGDVVEIPLRAFLPQADISAVADEAPRRSATAGYGGASKGVFAISGAAEPSQPESAPLEVFAVRLGEVILGTTARVDVTLRNRGPVGSAWALKWDDNALVVEPSSGTFGPDNRAARAIFADDVPEDGVDREDEAPEAPAVVTVSFEVTAKVVGPCRVRVVLDAPQLRKIIFDVSAVFVEQSLQLLCLSDRRPLPAVDFGPVFYGQVKERHAILVNNSSLPLPFLITVAKDRELSAPAGDAATAAAAADGDEAWDADDGAVTVSPLEGLLEPYESAPITFTFSPPEPLSRHAFKHLQVAEQLAAAGAQASVDDGDDDGKLTASSLGQRRVSSRPYGHRASISIQGASDDQVTAALDVALTGRAAPSSAIRCTPKTLRFGSCRVKQAHKALLTLENASDVSAKFEFARVAHFSLQPRVGKIAPRGCATVTATFHPASLGSFDVKCDVLVEGGLAKHVLRLLGEATMEPGLLKSGTGKVSAKYVVDNAGNVDRGAMGAYAALLSSGVSTWDKSGTWAGEAKGGSSYAMENAFNSGATPETAEELVQRDANRAQYVHYLRRSRLTREAAQLKVVEAQRHLTAGWNRADPKGVDLALQGIEEPPLPPLPDASFEPLYMVAGAKGGGSRVSGTAAFDADRLVLAKFKGKPSTQAEMRHCAARLSAAELAKVVPSAMQLDFGRVCVGSRVVKNFALRNGLPQVALVALSAASLPAELAGSTPMAQVVPGGDDVAGFDLIFESDRVGLFKAVLQYAVNDRHMMKLHVLADVVPVELTLASSSLEMAFEKTSLEAAQDQEIVVSNPGNCAVDFFWTAQPPFAVVPEQGVVAPASSTTVKVTWTPKPNLKNAGVVRAHVGGGKDLELKVVGLLDEAKCAFTEKKLDLGTLSLGDEREATCTVQNFGDCGAVCTIELPAEAMDVLRVSHSRFRLAQGASQLISVTFKPTAPKNLTNAQLVCNVRGGRAARLPLAARAIVPDINISSTPKAGESADGAVFDFGEQFVGFVERRRVEVRNDSEIAAALVLDVSKHRDFHAALSNHRDFHAESSKNSVDDAALSSASSMALVAATKDREEHWCMHISPHATLAFDLVFAPSIPATHDFVLQLELPNVSGEGKLLPQARVAGSASRPIIVMSATTVDFGERVVADAARPAPVSQDITLTNNHGADLTWTLGLPELLGGPDDDDDDATSGRDAPATTFHVLPRSGRLVPGESTTVRVTFAPAKAREYEARFPLSLAVDDAATVAVAPPGRGPKRQTSRKNTTLAANFSSSKPYLTLTAVGSGAHPRLEIVHCDFDDEPLTAKATDGSAGIRGPGDVIVLPTVPVGIVSRARFLVRNRGFEHISLNYRLPPHLPVKLEVEFPEGRALGCANMEIPVVVSFVSKTPVSFSSALHLLDSDGHAYSVSLAGACDNCTLTTHAFLHDYRSDFAFHVKEGTPPMLVDAQTARKLLDEEMKEKEAQRAARRGGKRPGAESLEDEPAPQPEIVEGEVPAPGIDVSRPRPLPADDLAPLVVAWLDYHALNSQAGAAESTTTKLRVIPDDVVATHGRLGLDAIEALAGRKIPGRLPARPPANDAELMPALVAQYRALLLFLKERGALLNTVRPEQLLGRAHYLRFREDLCLTSVTASSRQAVPTLTRAARESRHAGWDARYGATSKDAWLQVLLQSIRVFVLSRLTPKAFAALPGVLVPKAPRGAASPEGAKNKAGVDAELDGSNVFSQGECVLLKWLAYHVANGSSAGGGGASMPRKLGQFEDVFREGAPLAAVVASHAPWLADRGGALDTVGAAATKDDKGTAAARRFHHALQALRCQLGLEGSTPAADPEIVGRDAAANEEKKLVQGFLNLAGARATLYALHLYLALPAFVPKTTVEFDATLGVGMSKLIELRNSAAREIAYDVVLDGSGDFAAMGTDASEAAGPEAVQKSANKTVVVEPKSTAAYAVRLSPRFTRAVEARITFFALPAATPGPRPLPMVFALRSHVESKQPTEVVEADAFCYEVKQVDVKVTNPYDAAGSFSLTLVNSVSIEYSGPPKRPALAQGGGVAKKKGAPGKPKRTRPRGADGEPKGATDAELLAYRLTRAPFWTAQATVRLEARGSTTVTLQFVALMPGAFKCEVSLVNDDVGEFCVEARARVAMPRPLETLRFAVEAAEDATAVAKVLRVPAANSLLDRAVTSLLERLPAHERTAARAAMQSILKAKDEVKFDKLEDKGEAQLVLFEVSVDSPYFQTGQDIFMALDAKAAKDAAAKGAVAVKKPELVSADDAKADAPNAALVSFFPQKAGTYACTVVVEARPGAVFDIRVVQIEAVVTMPKLSTVLEFKAPARQKITQELPLTNNSDEDWQLTAMLSGSKAFSGPKTLKVPARGRATYMVTYAPTWTADEEAKLVLRNARSSDGFEYVLKGEGEPPLAEGHETLVCNARDAVTHAFLLENKTLKAIVYAVESDLPFVSGAATVEVPANSSTSYILKFSPALGGQYTGSVTFTATDSAEYVWFTVGVQVDSPLEESAIEMATTVRQAASAVLSLANPLDEAIEFDVVLQGEGLIGASSFVLGASETASYELFYTPLISQSHSGAVVFLNDRVGEFWYRLQLHAQRAEPTRLEPLRCAVGARTGVFVTVENPLDHEITLDSFRTNRENFLVEPATIAIKPYGSAQVEIIYVPSALHEDQATEVTLHHPELGDWEYVVSGRGHAPAVMQEHAPTAVIGEPSSYMFAFRNPFGEALKIDIVLREEGKDAGVSFSAEKAEAPALSLLMRRTTGVVLPPHGSISIPLLFDPVAIVEHLFAVDVVAEHTGAPLKWTFPIRGVVNAPIQLRAVSISAKAKTSTRHTVELQLSSIAELAESGEDFRFDVVATDDSQADVVKRSLNVRGLTTFLRKVDGKLVFQFQFEPVQPFSASAHLVVKRATGGRWPFEIQLDATSPDPDDLIQIEANLQQPSVVQFKLRNNTMDYAPFQAYFTTDSADTLAVAPSSGVLPPADAPNPQQFALTFCPVKYGMLQRGRLTIQTATMMWSYEVQGTHPAFVLPNATSKVDSHMSKKFLRPR